MPGFGAGQGQKGLRGAQSGRRGHPVLPDQDGQESPEMGGEFFLHIPLFDGLFRAASQLQPVPGLPGPEDEGGDLCPVQPELPGPLGLSGIGLRRAGDVPAPCLPLPRGREEHFVQGRALLPADQRQRLVLPPGYQPIGQVDPGGGVFPPAQPYHALQMDLTAILVAAVELSDELPDRPDGQGVRGLPDEGGGNG